MYTPIKYICIYILVITSRKILTVSAENVENEINARSCSRLLHLALENSADTQENARKSDENASGTRGIEEELKPGLNLTGNAGNAENVTHVVTLPCLDFLSDEILEKQARKDQIKNSNNGDGNVTNDTTLFIEDESEVMDPLNLLPSRWLGALPPFDPSSSPKVSDRCRRHSKRFMTSLRNFDFWALKMHDASGKLTSGILNGNVNQFGDFDQCLSVSSLDQDLDQNDKEEIRGKYCLAFLEINIPKSPKIAGKWAKIHRLIQSHWPFRSRMDDPGHRVPRFTQINWALCVPHECTPNDVTASLAHTVLGNTGDVTGVQIDVRVDPEMCQVKNDQKIYGWTRSDVLAWGFFAMIILIAISSTVYDQYADKPNKILVAFSLTRNMSSLLCTKPIASEIRAAHGIRFLNAVMLIIAHKSLALFFIPYVNRTSMAEIIGKPWTVIGRAASLYTDPFIMLSGLLTAHALLGRLRRGEKVSVVGEYAGRLVRIAPSLGALILFCTFVLPRLGSGPQWNLVVTHHAEICKKYWWRNMLFVHNYFGFENMCLTHTHHVGIDTQLFFAAVPSIYLLHKSPRKFATILLILAILSTAGRYYVTETRRLSNYIHFGTSVNQLFETANNMYILPVHRATVYIMGILLAFVLRMDKPVNLTKSQLRSGWAVASALLLGAFCLPAPMGDISYSYAPFHAALYAALAPIAWCAFYAWVVLTTHTGYDSLIGRIMSWRGFQVATRLSYSIYLTQFPVFFYNVGVARHAHFYEFFSMMFNIHELGWMLLCSMALTLLFDIPFQNIKKALFPRTPSKITSENTLSVKTLKAQ